MVTITRYVVKSILVIDRRAVRRLEVAERLVADGALVATTCWYLLAATRADFLRRLGRRAEAATAYREALALVGTEPERRFVESRLAEVAQG